MIQTGGQSVALVGTINRDTILTADGVETESYGGLLYSILSLAEIATDGAAIYPICNVGEDMEVVVREKISVYDSVYLDGTRFVPEKNPHCFLVYDAEGRKQETLMNDVPLIAIEHVRPFLDCGAICFNFITGMELSLETLQAVRAEAKGLICMDVHSLTLGMDDRRRRFWRVPPQWEAWLACVDVVQMNEQEGALLAGEALDSDAAIRRFADRVLSLGPSTLMITRTERGSLTIFRNGQGAVEVAAVDPCPAGDPQDETGCGDTFLMGFTWAYLQTNDRIRASRFANRVAGINVCLRGIEEIGRIGRFLGPEDRFVASIHPSAINNRLSVG